MLLTKLKSKLPENEFLQLSQFQMLVTNLLISKQGNSSDDSKDEHPNPQLTSLIPAIKKLVQEENSN